MDRSPVAKDIPPGILDLQCSDRYLADVAKKIVSWELLAPYFGIDRGEQYSIKKSCTCYEEERQEMLFIWKKKTYWNATNGALIKAINSSGNVDLYDYACQLLHSQALKSSSSAEVVPAISPVLAKFQSQLKLRYKTHKPVMVSEWPKDCYFGYVKLALKPKEKVEKRKLTSHMKVYLAYKGMYFVPEVDTSESQEVEVEQLLDLCNIDEHKIILFEGAPGSGKSTLLWHICQMWQSGEQFQQYILVLLVQLKDPAFHKAKRLLNLLPPRSQAKQVVSEIEATHGEGVLIMLDGWDEAPTELREEGSFFHDFIAKPSDWSLEKAVIVVSSRPLAFDSLLGYISHHVQLRGFTKEMRQKYIRQALSDRPSDAQNLIDKIESVEGSGTMDVSLPLNIASLVRIFRTANCELPLTPYRITIKLVLSIIFREIHKTYPGIKPVEGLQSFEDLPHPVSDWFLNICKIAYDGMLKEKFSFTGTEHKIMLGLLQPVHSLLEIGSSTVYHFVHLSYQELCAAYHVLKLCNKNRDHLNRLKLMITPTRFHRLRSVCNFYSALTSLKTLTGDEILKLKISYSSTEEDLVGDFDFFLEPLMLNVYNWGELTIIRRLHQLAEESNMDNFYEQWEPLGHTFNSFDRSYVATINDERRYKHISFLQFIAESMNTGLIDQVVGKEMRVQVDRTTEGTFSALVSMAPCLESVTYYMYHISPRMFVALRNKQCLKKFGLCMFHPINDCIDFKKLLSSLATCLNLQDVFLRVKFVMNVPNVNLLALTFRDLQLNNLCIDAQNSLEDAELALLAPAFAQTKHVTLCCKQIGCLGIDKLGCVLQENNSLQHFDMTVIEQYNGEDKRFFGCFKHSSSPNSFVVMRSKNKSRKGSAYSSAPSLADSEVGRVLLSGDLVELAEIFGLNDMSPVVDKTLHVHIFNCCLKIDFKNKIFKSVSLVDCEHKFNHRFEKIPIAIKNRITLNGVKTLCVSLQSIAVKELNLCFQKIDDSAAVFLGKALPTTMFLKELIIRDCDLGDEGILSVVRGLAHNQALVKLDAASNSFGDSGAIQLAKLINETSLTDLDIGNCHIREKGVVAIAIALRTNVTLRRLGLYQQQALTQHSKVELSRMLLQNRTLSFFKMNKHQSDDIRRRFYMSHAIIQTILTDMNPNEFYYAIKVSRIIAGIEVNNGSPLGHALISSNMKLAEDLLQLHISPNGYDRVELNVDGDKFWEVDYDNKRIIEYK